MSGEVRKLLSHDSVSEIAAAVAVTLDTPPVSVMFDMPNGSVEGRMVKPYSLERVRNGLGKFVVRGEVSEGPEDEIIIEIDPLATDKSIGTVTLLRNEGAEA